MDITIRELNAHELRTLFDAEHLAHSKEVSSGTYNLPYDPDFGIYENMLAEGDFLPLAAFVDGECAGYLNIIASRVLSSKGATVAVADSFYVSPKFRRMGIMDALVAEAEVLCKEAGVYSLSLTVMADKGGGEEFVKSLGYDRAEVTYTKVLNEE